MKTETNRSAKKNQKNSAVLNQAQPSSPNSRKALAEPEVNQRSPEIQKFDARIRLPLGLSDKVCKQSIAALNQVLADTITLRDMYKKHHWQVSGATFYQLHLLFDKHYDEQSKIVDLLAERIQLLGGVSIAMAHDVAETTKVERVPKGREEVPVQISRLLSAHELILKEARQYARAADEAGDDGTNDLMVSDVVRTNELQVWFLAEHLAKAPLTETTDSAGTGEKSAQSAH
ncbi:MAG: DNA starvation/stationary phase protection protein [Bdellovibrionaceae bacterium]|nr:DNA starvation/stationary phase protection protein [Pseudobdellovibrionaceae bacterium]